MKIIKIIALCIFGIAFIQAQNKPFYKQDFSSGNMLDNWTISEVKRSWDPHGL